ncbi:MAG: immune inhibitor A [Chloroflexi bacterium]|nr:immune inhibitor A [Chloroflexota bacterium]
MRFKRIMIVLALLLGSTNLAQDVDFPTLDALAKVEIPTFNFAEMVGRMSRIDTSYTPPANPPKYSLGDTETFNVDMGADEISVQIEAELRGQTQRVLIWVQATVDYPRWRALALAQRLESQVLNPMEQLFQTSEPPGIDGDPRLYVIMISDPEGDTLGYFPPASVRPRHLDSESNQREMLVADLSADDEYDFYDKILIELIAHEFTHILQFHSDPGEEIWLDEGLAGYAAYYASKSLFTRQSMHFDAEDFFAAPDTGLTQWQVADGEGRKYGASALFILYLTERFGKEIAARLLAEEADGWRAVEKVLREFENVSAEEVFADWALANLLLDFRQGYGYRALDADLTPPEPVASFNSFPATYESELPPFSTDYFAVDVRSADKLSLRLQQAPEAQLIPDSAPEGDYFAYALATDSSNSRLTRTFVLTAPRQAWLEFRVWYDLDYEWEYGYVTVSDDDGRTWRTLPSRYTTKSYSYQDFYDVGFTGSSRGWRKERIDLSQFTPGRVVIRFEVMSNLATSYRGMAIDDLRIRAMNYQEGFETPDDTWSAEGWIRTDNRLPNKTWLQAVQETRDGLHVSRALVSGSGDLTVDLLPGVDQVLVAVSPVVPYTGMSTDYELGFDLVDAEGEFMVVTRECTVTTTANLNFRATPNGNKIGLVPQGTALDALDRSEDWYMVMYRGREGWISAGYVNAAGKCP